MNKKTYQLRGLSGFSPVSKNGTVLKRVANGVYDIPVKQKAANNFY